LIKAIGTWVGNTCSILSKDSHWETAEDLSSLPREEKPIWYPYKAALIAVKFSNVCTGMVERRFFIIICLIDISFLV
jgi:hypothetical protein